MPGQPFVNVERTKVERSVTPRIIVGIRLEWALRCIRLGDTNPENALLVPGRKVELKLAVLLKLNRVVICTTLRF